VQPVWRWGFICGGIIILADLAAALLSAGQAPDSARLNAAQTVDLLVNLTLYSYCGYRVGLATGQIRAAAEAGVLAGALAGLAVIAAGAAIPPPADAPEPSPIAQLALNVAMGGVLAIGSGFLGTRQQQQPKR
jgi:hypothetical protein